MKEAKKEAEALCNAFRAEKEAAYQASMQKVSALPPPLMHTFARANRPNDSARIVTLARLPRQ